MGKSLMSCFLTHRVYYAKDIGEMSVESHNKEVQVVWKMFSTHRQLHNSEVMSIETREDVAHTPARLQSDRPITACRQQSPTVASYNAEHLL